MDKETKKQIVSHLSSKFKEATFAVLTDYRGLNVEKISQLRRELRNVSTDYRVAKNSLLKRASKGTDFEQLHVADNQIKDVSPLSGLMRIQSITIQDNPITNISPLVSNSGLARGDVVFLSSNALDKASMNVHIPALKERGVTIRFK